MDGRGPEMQACDDMGVVTPSVASAISFSGSVECQSKGCGHLLKALQGGGLRFVHVCSHGFGQKKFLPRFSPRAL